MQRMLGAFFMPGLHVLQRLAHLLLWRAVRRDELKTRRILQLDLRVRMRVRP